MDIASVLIFSGYGPAVYSRRRTGTIFQHSVARFGHIKCNICKSTRKLRQYRLTQVQVNVQVK